jgi:hypothetical protein
MNGKRLMSKSSECGSWNNLVDIDCTEAPKLKVHYTREVYDIKLISYGVTPVIDEHLLATKQSYTHASDSPYSIYIYTIRAVRGTGLVNLNFLPLRNRTDEVEGSCHNEFNLFVIHLTEPSLFGT